MVLFHFWGSTLWSCCVWLCCFSFFTCCCSSLVFVSISLTPILWCYFLFFTYIFPCYLLTLLLITLFYSSLSLTLSITVHSLSCRFLGPYFTISCLLLPPLFLGKINSFPSFLLSSLHLYDCWCASCPSVLAVHLLCTRPCFCSCLFPPLLTIANPLMSFPPIKAWAFPLPNPLSLSLVSTLGHLLPTLVLGALGRWVLRHGEDVVFKCYGLNPKIVQIQNNLYTWNDRDWATYNINDNLAGYQNFIRNVISTFIWHFILIAPASQFTFNPVLTWLTGLVWLLKCLIISVLIEHYEREKLIIHFVAGCLTVCMVLSSLLRM